MVRDRGHGRRGHGGVLLLVVLACAPEPGEPGEPSGDGSDLGVPVPCDDHSECGPQARCDASICTPCGDATDSGEPTCPLETIAVHDVRVSRMFQIHPPPEVAVLAVAWSDARLELLRRDGTGGLDVHWMLADAEVVDATTADLDGNGWNDAILWLFNRSHMSPLWLGPDDVTSPGSWTAPTTSALAALPPLGDLPAIVLSDGDEQVQWWYAFEAGLALGGELELPGASEMVALDLDGDAVLDLAAVTPDGRLLTFRREGAGLVPQHEVSDLLPADAWGVDLRAADVDGDGLDDLLVFAGVQPLLVIRSVGDDGVVLDATIDVESVRDAVVADFDADGRSELIVAGRDGLHAFDRGTDGHWSDPRVTALRHSPIALAPIDVDDDGQLDLLVGTYEGLGVLYAGAIGSD